MVLGFSVDGFSTRLAIFLAVNFFILESAHSLTETLVTLFGLVHFEGWIEGDLVLGILADGFLIRLANFFNCQFLCTGECSSFHKNLAYILWFDAF